MRFLSRLMEILKGRYMFTIRFADGDTRTHRTRFYANAKESLDKMEMDPFLGASVTLVDTMTGEVLSDWLGVMLYGNITWRIHITISPELSDCSVMRTTVRVA